MKTAKEEFKIKRADVYYTYSTYYIGPCVSPDLLAKLFLVKGLTKVVYDSNEFIYYFKEKEFVKAECDIKISPDLCVGQFSLKNWPKESFTQEILYQIQIDKYFEKRLLSIDDKYINNQYIRFSIDEIVLESDNYRIHLYPLVTIYTSGSMIIEYKCIIPSPIGFCDFFENFVHLTQHKINKCFCNKALSDLSQFNCLNYPDQIDSFNDVESDFKFQLYQFVLDQKENFTLTNITLSIFSILINVLNFEGKFDFFSLGNHWSMRPDVHIIEFNKQPGKSSTILQKYKKIVESLLLMVDISISNYYEREEVQNLRPFDDYLYFFTPGISLTVWSKKGYLSTKREGDKNDEHIISSIQIINRYLSYYDMLFEKPIEIIETCNDYSSILRYQEDFYLLDKDNFHMSHYGEIEDLLAYAKKQLKIEEKKQNAREYLGFKKLKLENKKADFFNKITLSLTILFGLLSSSTLSSDVIRPFWNLIHLPKSNNHNFNSIVSFLISLIFVLFVILMIFKLDLIKGLFKKKNFEFHKKYITKEPEQDTND